MIIIQSDERAPHGMIARIMDFSRQVGLVDQVSGHGTTTGSGQSRGCAESALTESGKRRWPLIQIDGPTNSKPSSSRSKPTEPSREIAYAVRQSIDKIRQEAMATDPDEWSDELKTQLLALKTQLFGLEPDSTIEEIAEKVRQRRLWQQAEETDPDEWSDELKTQLLALKPGNISYEIATATDRMNYLFLM